MKKPFLLLICCLLGLGSLSLYAQPAKGFFLGGGFNALMMNGTGEIDFPGAEKEDFDVTDDLVGFDDQGFLETPKGFGFSNKFIFGLAPIAGYRISPQFSVTGAYMFNFEKSGDGSDSGVDGDATHTQRTVQVLGQFYPSNVMFVTAGVEFVSVDQEVKFEDSQGNTLEGDTKGGATGIVVGGGLEVPLSANNQNITFTGLVTFSFANYAEDIDLDGADNGELELNVGGLAALAGLRFYFGN